MAVTKTERKQQRLGEVEKWAHDLSQNMLECRNYGHSWRPMTAVWIDEERVYEEVVRCVRCRSERLKLLDRLGMVVSSQYRYTRGYLKQGIGRLDPHDRGMLRLEAVQRRMDKTQ